MREGNDLDRNLCWFLYKLSPARQVFFFFYMWCCRVLTCLEDFVKRILSAAVKATGFFKNAMQSVVLLLTPSYNLQTILLRCNCPKNSLRMIKILFCPSFDVARQYLILVVTHWKVNFVDCFLTYFLECLHPSELLFSNEGTITLWTWLIFGISIVHLSYYAQGTSK